ncbi:Oxo-4-hydroxy-4-carboxy-5-ureidoimidazoline decarboxylase [Cytidiella melzeri]|nr:Oxo-4-hydroxy-4-carboxy-5-ureidoimidazoline decarboxylase [Cytidiella melzeri]
MSSDSFPAIQAICSSSTDHGAPLATALSTLFEPSEALFAQLVPQAKEHLSNNANVNSYSELVEIASDLISRWDEGLKARFIAGHPRIGEVKNLSKLSAQEQAIKATPPEVLVRLQHLNACYEHRYPGLIYITFVNGRTRTAIMEEMEDALGLSRSLSADQPSVSSLDVIPRGEDAWKAELERAVKDVCRIAKSRVEGMGPL